MNTSDNTTFGVELEFICLRPQLEIDIDPVEDEEASIGLAIYRHLIAKGIRATGYEYEDWGCINSQWPSHSRWRVETDELVLSEGEERLLPDNWVMEAVELSSRKLHFVLEDWRAEVAAVLQVLRDVENDVGCRFITNKSTGFHVHVGHNAQRVPLRTAKNVFQLATAFEKNCFDELHTVPRITVPDDHGLLHNYFPPSFFHTYTSTCDRPEGISTSSLLDRLANIEAVSSYEELGAFFRVFSSEYGPNWSTSGHNSAYNFDNLFPDPSRHRHEENLTGTIEFRQHTGTLDFVEIVAWVSLVCQLVIFSNKVPASDFLDLIIRSIDTNFRLQDLLLAIGCTTEVLDHYLNGTIIGVVSEGSCHLSGSTTDTPVDLLIAQNDIECEERCDRTAVRAAINQKYLSGLYGLDPNFPQVHLPHSTAASELWKATVTVRMSGSDLNTEEGISEARWQVLRHFAQLYNCGTTNFNRASQYWVMNGSYIEDPDEVALEPIKDFLRSCS